MSASKELADTVKQRQAVADVHGQEATNSSPKPQQQEGQLQPNGGKDDDSERQEKERTEQSETQTNLNPSQEQSQDEPEGTQSNTTESEVHGPEKKPRKLTFLDYLKSPIVELVVGKGEKKTTLTAHQALLAESPYIREIIDSEESPVGQIFLPEESVEAVGCFLQYQYRGEYIAYSDEDGDTVEIGGANADSGEELLRHARVFFLASKFGHDELKRLARHKIHRVESTPRGEIAYARYVYGNKSTDAAELRKPVANFWASNEALRDEVKEEFKATCLDFPEFSYDILSSDKKRPASGTPSREEKLTAAKRRRSRRD
ncbi:hypothetical protein KEM54_002938 [Ascosphaera aggregata]|nr:hypothetical protein KEM54_002938 [Ascosphaera aggregata]